MGLNLDGLAALVVIASDVIGLFRRALDRGAEILAERSAPRKHGRARRRLGGCL